VLLPDTHGKPDMLKINLHSPHKAKQIYLFDDPEILIVHYFDASTSVEFLQSVMLDKSGESIVTLEPNMHIAQVVRIPNMRGKPIRLAFLIHDKSNGDAKMLSLAHLDNMGIEKSMELNPHTTDVTAVKEQFVVLLLLSPRNTYQIQGLNTETNEMGMIYELPDMYYSPYIAEGKLKGGKVALQVHLPFDDGPLGCQLIACFCSEGCTYLARGLHFYPLQKFAPGLNQCVSGCSLTHWKGKDGTVQFKFFFTDISDILYEYTPF